MMKRRTERQMLREEGRERERVTGREMTKEEREKTRKSMNEKTKLLQTWSSSFSFLSSLSFLLLLHFQRSMLHFAAFYLSLHLKMSEKKRRGARGEE